MAYSLIVFLIVSIFTTQDHKAHLSFPRESLCLRPLAYQQRPQEGTATLASPKETLCALWRQTALAPELRSNLYPQLRTSYPRQDDLDAQLRRFIIPPLRNGREFRSWNLILEDLVAKGVDITIYRTTYGDLGIYFFLRDVRDAGYQLSGPPAPTYRDPINRSPQKVAKEINKLIRMPDGSDLFSINTLATAPFFAALARLAEQPNMYRSIGGMLRLAEWLEARGYDIHLGHLDLAFGGESAVPLLRALSGRPLPASFTLDWAQVPFPYKRLRIAAHEVYRNRARYTEVEGMLRCARQLWKMNEETNLWHLYYAFGNSRGREVITTLVPDNSLAVDFDLGWKPVGFPYDTALEVLKIAYDKVTHDGWNFDADDAINQLYDEISGTGRLLGTSRDHGARKLWLKRLLRPTAAIAQRCRIVEGEEELDLRPTPEQDSETAV